MHNASARLAARRASGLDEEHAPAGARSEAVSLLHPLESGGDGWIVRIHAAGSRFDGPHEAASFAARRRPPVWLAGERSAQSAYLALQSRAAVRRARRVRRLADAVRIRVAQDQALRHRPDGTAFDVRPTPEDVAPPNLALDTLRAERARVGGLA
jgi:hypothetical protein